MRYDNLATQTTQPAHFTYFNNDSTFHFSQTEIKPKKSIFHLICLGYLDIIKLYFFYQVKY